MMYKETKNEVVVKAHTQLIEDFTHEYITSHTVCSPDDFKRRVWIKFLKILKTLIAIILGIYSIVLLYKYAPSLLIVIPFAYIPLGFMIYDGIPTDYYDKSFIELTRGLERFFWLSDKLEQMCYMSYEDLLKDHFVNEILGINYIEDKKKLKFTESALTQSAWSSYGNGFEVVHTKNMLDIGLLTEFWNNGIPKTILGRSSKYNMYPQYGAVESLEWTRTGIFMTREEWRRISYETPTHVLRERLGLGKSETESISRSHETKSMFSFEDWGRVNEAWGTF